MPAASLQEPEKASPIALCHLKKQLDTIEYYPHKLTQRIYNEYLPRYHLLRIYSSKVQWLIRLDNGNVNVNGAEAI